MAAYEKPRIVDLGRVNEMTRGSSVPMAMDNAGLMGTQP
jgi:hypothetical protein